MGNNNTNNNPATPDGQPTQSTNGAPNRTTVVKDQRTGNLPNQPPGGNTNAIPKPGEPTNPPAPQPQNSTQPAAGTVPQGSGTVSTDTGLDIDRLISESTQEIKAGDDAQKARVEKQKMLMTALNSKNYMETIIYKNEETDEEIGRNLRYVPDPYGKTIYDYMNDPEVTAHIGFKVDENDPQDGSFIEKQISVYWINPVF